MSSTREMIARFQRSQKMTLWTVQTWEAWEGFQRKGVLRGDGRRVIPEFRRAYHWMMAQMRARIPGYSGRYPLWAWYHPRPYLRCSGLLPAGTRGVCIEFSVPSDRVILSDFDAWHAVLNGSYLALSQEEYNAFEGLLPDPQVLHNQLPLELQQRIEESWQRVFDLQALMASDYASPSRYIQAVVEEVRLEEVRRVVPFTAR